MERECKTWKRFLLLDSTSSRASRRKETSKSPLGGLDQFLSPSSRIRSLARLSTHARFPRWIPQLARTPLHLRSLPACAAACAAFPRAPLPLLACQNLHAGSCELVSPVLAALPLPVLLLRLQFEFPNPTFLQILCSLVHLSRLRSPVLARLVSATMNPLRPPSSSSRQGRVGKGRGAPAAQTATRSAWTVAVAPAVPAHGSNSAAVNPGDLTAATSPPIACLQATAFPEWWRSSSPMGSNEGAYRPGGFINLMQSNNAPENFHLVGNTTSRTSVSPGEGNAQDNETINIDGDETVKDSRTEKRLNWTKDEDIRVLRGEAPKVQYSINGREYDMGYYLADGIYPEWPVFVKSFREPQSDKHKLFAQHQEGARKDVECAFGILQSRFCILRRPALLYEQGDLENITLACIILHNMIIEDERDIEQVPLDLNEKASTYTVHQATITHGENPEMEDVLSSNFILHDRSIQTTSI